MDQLHSEGVDVIKERDTPRKVIHARYQAQTYALFNFLLSCFSRRRYGPAWTGGDMIKDFGGTKDYLGIIFPIAISAVGTSLMALVSAKAAGTAHRIRLCPVSLAIVPAAWHG